MSRWRAAPPSTGMEWEQSQPQRQHQHTQSDYQQRQVSYEGQSFSPQPFPRLSHYSSPLSLAAYQLIPSSSPSHGAHLLPPLAISHDQLPAPQVQRPRPTLPVELYRIIVQHITSVHDLCILARVSRAFQSEAERVLYHTLQMRHHIQTLWRCESLAKQPRLALYVRRLSIIIDQYTVLESMSRALKCCSDLQHLELKGAPFYDYSKVLDAVSSTGIRKFTCHSRGEAGIIRFLERQPYLEEVDFEAHGFELETLSPYAVQNLHVFTGWLATAATLVPGRPVRRLTLTSDMANDETVRAVKSLSKGSVEVEALDIRIGVLRNPIPWIILEGIFTSLKGLRYLGVCSLECARHPSFTFYLMGLPHLQTIVFGTGTDDSEKYDERVLYEMVHRLGQSCESLSQVIVCQSAWKRDWIWTRDISQTLNWAQSSRSNAGQEWWGMISHEQINLEELARLHVESSTS